MLSEQIITKDYLSLKESINIRILGAHNSESQQSKCLSLLINDTLAIDAGGLTSSLSLECQSKIKALFLTHHHFDHIKDIPMFAINLYRQEKSFDIYCTHFTYEAVTDCIFNGKIYPKFHELPILNPTVNFHIIEAHNPVIVEGLKILPLPVNHTDDTIGYHIVSKGDSVFYTGDTGPDLTNCWKYISPDLLLIEATFPNQLEKLANICGHLVPRSLGNELHQFKKIKGYLPKTVVVHTDPYLKNIIIDEIKDISKSLGTRIEIADDGMQIKL